MIRSLTIVLTWNRFRNSKVKGKGLYQMSSMYQRWFSGFFFVCFVLFCLFVCFCFLFVFVFVCLFLFFFFFLFFQFIAHKKLQEFLWRRWRLGFSEHIERSHIRRFLVTTLLMVFWPLFSLLYLIMSGFRLCEPFTRLLKAP